MKFGKNLLSVVALSDPEWSPFWMNYKQLKKMITDIVDEQESSKSEHATSSAGTESVDIAKSVAEVEFFRFLMLELRKTSDFFASSEHLYKIRRTRIADGLHTLQEKDRRHDKNTWTRLLTACVRFYRDVLLLENYSIMHFCGFSKILKKHDKMTGRNTRDAFMRNVMRSQNFVDHPYVLELLKESEALFEEIQGMESVMPLREEERLFIEAMRDLNYQASRLQSEEQSSSAEANNDESAHSLDEIQDSIAVVALKARIALDNVPQSPVMNRNMVWMQENFPSGASSVKDVDFQRQDSAVDNEDRGKSREKKAKRALSDDK